jgi:hypothetical protein
MQSFRLRPFREDMPGDGLEGIDPDFGFMRRKIVQQLLVSLTRDRQIIAPDAMEGEGREPSSD